VTRVALPLAGGAPVDLLAPMAVFGPDSNDSVDLFCDELSASLRRLETPRRTLLAVMGTTQELLHNVLSHASARHASAVALLHVRKRPRVLQVGIADDGVGIAGAVLHQERHRWLEWFHDTSVTEAVLQQALTGRPSAPEAGNGGGMARIIRRLLSESASTVMLRSGAALILLRSTTPDRCERHTLTYGAGTQVRLEIRLGA
jgi:hypothetical protein